MVSFIATEVEWIYHSLTLLELNKCWFETLFVEMQFHLKAWDDAVFKGLSYNFISKVAIILLVKWLYLPIFTRLIPVKRESTKRLGTLSLLTL